MELQKSVDKEENKEDLLNTSGDITGKHNSVVQNIEEELIDKEKENYFLHKSVDITKYVFIFIMLIMLVYTALLV